MLMISRMINVVNEQGTYWVANNFMGLFITSNNSTRRTNKKGYKY